MAGRPAKPMLSGSAIPDLEVDGALSYATAAVLSSLSERTIMRAAKANLFETFTVGGRVLIVRKSFVVWLASHLEASRARRAHDEACPSASRE